MPRSNDPADIVPGWNEDAPLCFECSRPVDEHGECCSFFAQDLVDLHFQIDQVLQLTRSLFNRPRQITYIARDPNDEGVDVIITDDNLDQVRTLIIKKIREWGAA